MKRGIFVVGAVVIIVFIGWAHFLAVTFAESPSSAIVLNEKLSIYRDAQNRFEFSYPANFGIPTSDIRSDMPGGDSGEAFFFPQFSHGFRNGKVVLEGDVVVRSGRAWVSGALGGLYDPILVGGFISVFPPVLQKKLFELAENLTIPNFCNELSKAEHIAIDDPALADLSGERKQAVIELDQMRNLDPKVITCKIFGDTVVFDKQVLARFGKFSNIQHIYGAIRFMNGLFTSVQFIRITREPPSEKLLETMTKVVQSFKLL